VLTKKINNKFPRKNVPSCQPSSGQGWGQCILDAEMLAADLCFLCLCPLLPTRLPPLCLRNQSKVHRHHTFLTSPSTATGHPVGSEVCLRSLCPVGAKKRQRLDRVGDQKIGFSVLQLAGALQSLIHFHGWYPSFSPLAILGARQDYTCSFSP
jgi:hypothetical protein